MSFYVVKTKSPNLLILMEKENVKKLSFWLGLICTLIVIIEIVLNMVGIAFEIKIVIEIVSYVLAILVSAGVLKSNLQGKNIVEIKEEVEKELQEKVSTKDKNK